MSPFKKKKKKMPYILIRNFPSDFVPDQRALWCLFGSVMAISTREDKEDVPLSEYIPKRPSGLARYTLVSSFWGKQLSRGWFAICQLEKISKLEKKTKNDHCGDDDDSTNSSSNSTSDDDDDDGDDTKENEKFPELWISNTKLEVLSLPDRIAQSTVGLVDVTHVAKEVVHQEREKKFGVGVPGAVRRARRAEEEEEREGRSSQLRKKPEGGGGGDGNSSVKSNKKSKNLKTDGGSGFADRDNKKHVQFSVVEVPNQQQQQQQQPTATHEDFCGAAAAADTSSSPSSSSLPASQSNKQDHQATSAFGPDCCQKCGSKSHFTRKCPHKNKSGEELAKVIVLVGAASEEKTIATNERASGVPAAAAAVPAPAAFTVAAPPLPMQQIPEEHGKQQKAFGPDCCQKCGSKAHFTRKCPLKNNTNNNNSKKDEGAESLGGSDVVVPATAVAVVAPEEPASKKKETKEKGNPREVTKPKDEKGGGEEKGTTKTQQQQQQQQVTEVASVTVARALPPAGTFGKDCCQMCGSKDHFTRKCPNKKS